MEYVGEILSNPDSDAIDKQRWLDLIGSHPRLVPDQPREGINPFTKQSMVNPPCPDLAHVVIDGRDVGWMSWNEDDSIFINVVGEPEAMIPVAQEIAEYLVLQR